MTCHRTHSHAPDRHARRRRSCWHCGRPIDAPPATQAARYLYRGDQPLTVVVEDWMRCTCGAYQNVRRLNEIRVEAAREQLARAREGRAYAHLTFLAVLLAVASARPAPRWRGVPSVIA